MIIKLRELTLCWIQSLTYTPNLMFSFVCASGPSSYSTSHFLLTTYLTNYCPNQILYYLVLRKTFYSRQSLKDTYCSSACIGYKRALQYKASMQKDTSMLF